MTLISRDSIIIIIIVILTSKLQAPSQAKYNVYWCLVFIPKPIHHHQINFSLQPVVQDFKEWPILKVTFFKNPE